MESSTYDAPQHGSAPAANGTQFKDAAVNNAASVANTVQNHPITQNVVNGPVATSVKDQAAHTSNEFSGLANSRAPPNYSAANETPLTNYHSFFYTLLSWEHKRATALSFLATVAFIFACRYMPLVKYALRMTYLVLGVVTLAEVAAKIVGGGSLATSLRPRRYYKIPKETLEASLDDLEQLINFFVIEVQRIVFAENIPATGAAFVAAFLSYYLIKILPLWGMALLGTCVLYLAPLIYVENKELIDGHVQNAGNVLNQQATQVKDLTAQHTGKGIETLKAYTGEYASKASDMVGKSRQKIPTPATGTSNTAQSGTSSMPATTQQTTPSDYPPSGGQTAPSAYPPSEGQTYAA